MCSKIVTFKGREFKVQNNTLDLSDQRIRHIGLLHGFNELSDLERLDLSFNELSDVEIRGLTHLVELKELNLSYNHLDLFRPPGLRPLGGLKPFDLRNLETLDVSFNEITSMDGLKALPKINLLRIEGNPVTKYYTVYNNRRNFNYTMGQWGVTPGEITDDDRLLAAINRARNHPQFQMTWVDVPFYHFYHDQTDRVLCPIYEGTLCIQGYEPREHGWEMTDPIVIVESLEAEERSLIKRLKVNGCGSGIIQSESQDYPNLEVLDFYDNRIGIDNIVDAISNIPPKLKILNVSKNEITKIDGLMDLNKLEELNLSHNQISKITGLQKLPQLRYLDLSYNQISEISNLASIKSLRWLDLSGNPIQQVKGLNRLQTLEALTLTDTQISQIDCQELPPNLKYLNLGRSKIDLINREERASFRLEKEMI
ncbi:MAG: leucine-rich repeat domain-containing protein [Candidatus Helarchaeota archaeon]|nr:leucine-rich repeat domain-containing protein [Candidatus Helarchaeota archaeon]